MSLKNYYAILGVPRNAQQEQIKAAFRAAAKKYHPDTAPENPYAGAHFKELREAYEILSNPAKRAQYDEECWLRGLYQAKGRFAISPQWMLQEAIRLQRHIATVDTYRMNHAALYEFVAALLSDEHLSVMREAPDTHGPVLEALLPSLQDIDYRFVPATAARLMLLAGNNGALRERVASWAAERGREAAWNRYRPLIVIVAALIICIIIWTSVRR